MEQDRNKAPANLDVYFITALCAQSLYAALQDDDAPKVRILLHGVAILNPLGLIGADPVNEAMIGLPGYHCVAHVLTAPEESWLRRHSHVTLSLAVELAKRPNVDGGQRVH